MQKVRDLEAQVNQINELYDLAEQYYPAENFYGQKQLNDNDQRRKLQEFEQYGPSSFEVLKGSGNYGLLSVYLFSRRGATGLLDFRRVKADGFRSLSWFMLGCSFGMALELVSANDKYGNAATINMHRRVAQNLRTASLIHSMQHHLMTR